MSASTIRGPEYRSVHTGTMAKCPLVFVSSMSDRKFTFIELHLDGNTQFGPKTISDALPIGAEETADETLDSEEEAAAATEEESGGKGAIGVVVALIVLAGIAFAVKKFRSGDEEDAFEEREEPDVVVN